MTSIFIAGSIAIKQLSPDVKARLNNIIASNFTVLLGDANGVDSVVQAFLHTAAYPHVQVYCSGVRPRNNLGGWPIVKVTSSHRIGSREFFTAKDVAMANAADYGLMVWDQASTGTLSNVLELLAQRKKCVVYLRERQTFLTLSKAKDCEKLVEAMSDNARDTANKKIKLEQRLGELLATQVELF